MFSTSQIWILTLGCILKIHLKVKTSRIQRPVVRFYPLEEQDNYPYLKPYSDFGKSTHNLISPFFFLMGTRFSTHCACCTGKIILAARILLISFLTAGSRLGCIFLNFCWNGLAYSFMGMTCCIMLGSNVLRSSYVQEKVSLNSLKSRMRAVFSWGVHVLPRFTH